MFLETSSKALTGKLSASGGLKYSLFLNIYHYFFHWVKVVICFWFSFKRCTFAAIFFFACLSDVTVFRTVCSSSVVSLSSMKLPSSISRFFCSWTSFRITFSIRNTVRSYSNFWYSRSCKVTVLPLSSQLPEMLLFLKVFLSFYHCFLNWIVCGMVESGNSISNHLEKKKMKISPIPLRFSSNLPQLLLS